jgi:hypothetical protein
LIQEGPPAVVQCPALQGERYPVKDEDKDLSPLIHEHINMLGRYSFVVPETM